MGNRSKLLAALKAAGLDPSVASFDERKKVQKLVYLLQLFGINLGFSYSWYLHGPYSPDLTKVLFDTLGNLKSIPLNVGLTHDDERKLERLKAFLGERIKSTDFLELLVSLHYLRRIGSSSGASKEDILRVLKEKKPFFADREVVNCWEKLEELDLLTSFRPARG